MMNINSQAVYNSLISELLFLGLYSVDSIPLLTYLLNWPFITRLTDFGLPLGASSSCAPTPVGHTNR